MLPQNLERDDRKRIQKAIANYGALIYLDDYQVKYPDQVNALINYYRELIPAVRAYIRRANQPEGRESVKISETVQNNLRYIVLLNPLATFASSFTLDMEQEQASALMNLYMDLEAVYYYLYSTRDWANEQQHLDLFVQRHNLQLVEAVLQQMYDYLNCVLHNMFNIYAFAVGYYYGTDSESESYNFRALTKDKPFIKEWPLSNLNFRNTNFMYYFVMASQIYYRARMDYFYALPY